MVDTFSHVAQNLTSIKPLVYTAMSKHLFFYRMFISKYVLENGAVPLNPFMIFDYFLLDTVDRNLVREGNNNLVMKSDEIWVFGAVSNGVLAEIELAKKMKKPIKYFKIEKQQKIIECAKEDIEFEDEIKNPRDLL
ncbi:MAG: hypothetical protein WBO77_04730 [Microgenomates group bacterium]